MRSAAVNSTASSAGKVERHPVPSGPVYEPWAGHPLPSNPPFQLTGRDGPRRPVPMLRRQTRSPLRSAEGVRGVGDLRQLGKAQNV